MIPNTKKKIIKDGQKTEASNEIPILMFCDYNATTGFGKVANEFINEVKKDPKVMIVIHAINDFSDKPYQVGDNIWTIPTWKNKKNDPYGRIEFLKDLYQINYKLVFLLNDIEIVTQLIPHILNVKRKKKSQKRPDFKLVTYTPVDSHVNKEDVAQFHYIDLPITYTNYAREHLETLNPKLLGKIKVLPHGTDLDTFFEMQDKDGLKEKILGKEFKDHFVFGTVNRNQVRKDFGTLLIAFSKFKEVQKLMDIKEKSLLYLHCNPLDPSGLNLFNSCQRLGLKVNKDVHFPKNFNENKGVEVSQLNEIYNMMDCFVTTTTSEGWGLTVTEAMATKTPVICPMHTSLKEITDCGRLVAPIWGLKKAMFLGDFEKVRFVSDYEEVALKMGVVKDALVLEDGRIYHDISIAVKKAHKFVSGLKWSDISAEFNNLFKALLDEKN